jgi:hypothetical protein
MKHDMLAKLSRKWVTKFTMETDDIPTAQVRSHPEITNENDHHLLRYKACCSLWTHSTRPNSQPSLLYGNKEVVTWNGMQRNAWTLARRLESPPWQCSSSQGSIYQAFSGQIIDYWNGTPTLLLWFGSEWLVAVSKNKVCLKVTKILG